MRAKQIKIKKEEVFFIFILKVLMNIGLCEFNLIEGLNMMAIQ